MSPEMVPREERSSPRRTVDWTLAYIAIAAVGLVAILAMVTTPVAALLGDSEYAIPSTLHGISAMLYVIVSTAGLYMVCLLFTGRLEAYRDMRIIAGLQAFLSVRPAFAVAMAMLAVALVLIWPPFWHLFE